MSLPPNIPVLWNQRPLLIIIEGKKKKVVKGDWLA